MFLLFITLFKVVLTFEFVGKTQVCDHSNESYWAVPPCSTIHQNEIRDFFLNLASLGKLSDIP